MIERIPSIIFFTKGYWNQMGPDVYGSIDRALTQMLSDTKKMPNEGIDLVSNLKRELTEINRNGWYSDWLRNARFDVDVINSVGGAFVMPDEVPLLLRIIEEQR